MKYTIQELEIFAKLELRDERSKAEQRRVASYLAKIFETGSKEAAKSAAKAYHYHEQAGEPNTSDAPPKAQSGYYFQASSWYNHFRIFLIRNNLVTEFFGHAFLTHLCSIAGFAYLIDFSLDLGIVLKNTFEGPRTEEEAAMGKWALRKERFINSITEDGRLSRMANSGPWFVINFVAFWLTGGLSAILNVCGFGYDIFHELYDSWDEYSTHKNYYHKVTTDLEEKKAELEQLEKRPGADPKAIEKLKDSIAILAETQIELKKELENVVEKRLYSIVSTTLVLTGIILMCFPPTAFVGMILTSIGIGMSVAKRLTQFCGWLSKKLSPTVSEPIELEEKGAEYDNSYKNCLVFFKDYEPMVPTPLRKETAIPLLVTPVSSRESSPVPDRYRNVTGLTSSSAMYGSQLKHRKPCNHHTGQLSDYPNKLSL